MSSRKYEPFDVQSQIRALVPLMSSRKYEPLAFDVQSQIRALREINVCGFWGEYDRKPETLRN